jgi:hypothetical protein
MNERIKLLAEQATTYIESTATSGEGWIFDKEKFAELIVKECASVALMSNGNNLYVCELIKEHFGVEE